MQNQFEMQKTKNTICFVAYIYVMVGHFKGVPCTSTLYININSIKILVHMQGNKSILAYWAAQWTSSSCCKMLKCTAFIDGNLAKNQYYINCIDCLSLLDYLRVCTSSCTVHLLARMFCNLFVALVSKFNFEAINKWLYALTIVLTIASGWSAAKEELTIANTTL